MRLLEQNRKWVVVLVAAAALAGLFACQSTPTGPVPGNVITGVVAGPKGREAGVWVIAETNDLPTRYTKIVVTDDRGRYLLPDLPQAEYRVWVRGYGLVDSTKINAKPGNELNLAAVPAPDARAAAQYYPAGYWWSLVRPPAASEFPGTGDKGNGIATTMRSQAEWVRNMHLISQPGVGGCMVCHTMGGKSIRELDPQLAKLSSVDAWRRRVTGGQMGALHLSALGRGGLERELGMFADWTDRIAKGEYPTQAPTRPQGVERNVVLTLWDWAEPTGYVHDMSASDRRDPRANANGPVFGAMEASSDYLPFVDPVKNTANRVALNLIKDPETPISSPQKLPAPSLVWGEKPIWATKADVHNPMMDQNGRWWFTTTIRRRDNPDFCKQGSKHPAAQAIPINISSRQLGMYDPKTGEQVGIDTCFSTDHLMFAWDANNTLWMSGGNAGGPIVGWLDTRKFLETRDAAASQGWTPIVLDTNGDGQRGAYTFGKEPLDPTRDRRIETNPYVIVPARDGSVWFSCPSCAFPGAIVRLNPGPDPVRTSLAEVYEMPWNAPGYPNLGFGPRGLDVDRNGVVWAPLSSGHLASFDRRKCKGPLNGPKATGQHCPEGWTFITEPLPHFQGVTAQGSVAASYNVWVDYFNTLGLGENLPISTGNLSEGLLVLRNGEWVTLRVPYPLGFYTKWLDGRIDDPNAGWRGRGLWANVASRAPWHQEGGKGMVSKLVHFQLRPNPLAE